MTGTILSGSVSVGDRVTISPSGLSARVRSIHAQNTPREQGFAGERCALNLAGDGIAKDAIHRGDVVLDPELHAPTDRIDCTIRLLASEAKPVTQWTPVHLHHAASDIGARIVLLQDQPILPGEQAFAQLVLDQPLAAAIGRPLRAARHHRAAHHRRRPVRRSAGARAQAAHAGANGADRSASHRRPASIFVRAAGPAAILCRSVRFRPRPRARALRDG